MCRQAVNTTDFEPIEGRLANAVDPLDDNEHVQALPCASFQTLPCPVNSIWWHPVET